jgi:hypothetical protein
MKKLPARLSHAARNSDGFHRRLKRDTIYLITCSEKMLAGKADG